MNCRSCGSQLPEEAKVCPNCGTPTYSYYSDGGTLSSDPARPQAGSSPSPDPTLAASPSSTPPYLPSTGYGSNPYTPADQQNPYPPPTSPYPYSPPPLPPPNPYAPPQAGPYPSFPPVPPPATSPGQPPPRRFPTGLAVLLILLVVLLIGGSALIYYTTVYQPNQLHTQATATAEVHLTSTAQAQATSTAQINATATAVAENPYTHSGTLTLFDPLRDNSKGYNWAQDPTNCGFKDGAYHANAPDPRFSDYCMGNATDFSNFAFEVQMQLIKGDSGGIVFRAENTATTNKLYAFYVGEDGSYSLNMQNGSSFPVLRSGNNEAIKQGLNQTNVVAVVAQGSNITLYVNQQQITSVTNGTYPHGQIGFIVGAFGNAGHPTEAVFSNAKVWTL